MKHLPRHVQKFLVQTTADFNIEDYNTTPTILFLVPSLKDAVEVDEALLDMFGTELRGGNVYMHNVRILTSELLPVMLKGASFISAVADFNSYTAKANDYEFLGGFLRDLHNTMATARHKGFPAQVLITEALPK